MKFFSFTTEISYTWIRDISNTYTYLNIPWLCDSDNMCDKITLICLYLLQYNTSPSINYSDNRLLLLNDNIFQTLPPPPSPIYWYFRYLSDSSFLLRPFPFIWNWRVKDLNFFFESSKTWYNNWHMLLTITTNNWYMLFTTTTDDFFFFFFLSIYHCTYI